MTENVQELYDTIGARYSAYRRPDARIAQAIHAELGRGATVVNLGAGVGSYEPRDRHVIAVDPSGLMISQRPRNAAPVVRARAELLPFKDNAFDVAAAILSIHHWSDIEKGLLEARRVAKHQIVLLTWIGFCQDFWLLDYLPQIREIDEPLFPSIEDLAGMLGPLRVIPVPIPYDCTDGFLCAYWRRPHAYLDEDVRRAISTFARVRDFEDGLRSLDKDLRSGAWRRRYAHLFESESMDYGYRLVVTKSETESL
jgi:SAM-dependent methyltransferase